MAINLSIEDNLKELDVFLNDVRTKALVKATRRSITRTLPTLQKVSSQAVRREIRLKPTEIRKIWFRLKKSVSGNVVSKFFGELTVKNRPVSLIRLVKGSKNVRPQKGVPVRKRKKVKVEVRPGSPKVLARAFLARGKNNMVQVFRRRTSKSVPIIKQSVPSIHLLFRELAFTSPIEKEVGTKFAKEFVSNMKFFLNRLK